MPKRRVNDIDYYLILFDRDGRERRESDQLLLSDTLAELVTDGVTDVFLASHGWKGDVPAAIDQYDRWTAAMAGQSGDRARAVALDPGFRALTIGVHWPSLPWGDDRVGAALLGEEDEFAVEAAMPADDLVDRYADRIADTPPARAALAEILAAADNPALAADLEAGTVPAGLETAYRTLFAEAGLELHGVSAGPGQDQEAFSPAVTMADWAIARPDSAAPAAGPGQPHQPGQPGLLGGGFWSGLKDTVLSPVRQLSFWTMKNRARLVGETGVHQLLRRLQQAAPNARFHLMGHSFGCIVVTAAITGPISKGTPVNRLHRPVDSLFLVQGAMSLWSFAGTIPYPPAQPGYFRPALLDPAAVTGPVVTTRSSHDRAVGTFYPLGAKVGRDRLLGDDDLPEYGGIGAFGIQGAEPVVDHEILTADADYGLQPGTVYNIDASSVICTGEGPSGAHSDIAHPQVAHLFWQAALTALRATPGPG